jgi:two-component system NarL family response regulator
MTEAVSQPAPIRVLVADDHLIVRLGLVALINSQSDMTVAAQASSGSDAVALHAQHKPDVTLMDLRMPGQDGVEAIESIRRVEPAARVIVLTIHAGDEAVYRALRAGARGYLLKTVSGEEIVAAIRAVRAGNQWIPEEIADLAAERMQQPPLSVREIDVLKRIAKGLSNKRIAEELDVSESTVRNHVASLLDKLGADDRTHAVTVALDRGIIDLAGVRKRDRRA